MNSTHWRSMFDSKYIGAWDLPGDGKDVTVVIERVEAGALDLPGTSQKKRKPIVYMKGAQKGFALNKTNAKTIARLYGNDTANWIGKPITIFATTTAFGDETVECIRVRPKIPQRRAPKPQQAPPPSNGTPAPAAAAEAAPEPPATPDPTPQSPGVETTVNFLPSWTETEGGDDGTA